MSQFYFKYRHLFDDPDSIKFPSIKKNKFSDYQPKNMSSFPKSKSKSILSSKPMPAHKPFPMKQERAMSYKRPDYNDIKERLFPKWGEVKSGLQQRKNANFLIYYITCFDLLHM